MIATFVVRVASIFGAFALGILVPGLALGIVIGVLHIGAVVIAGVMVAIAAGLVVAVVARRRAVPRRR